MRNEPIPDLSSYTPFRQALWAQPPAVLHATLGLLTLLLGVSLSWAWLTRADLVVRARGRIRPVAAPVKVFSAARGESLSGSVGGRVVEVCAREGDAVRGGDVLIRLDADRLDNEIGRQVRAIKAAEEELARLDLLEGLLARHSETARAKAAAELAQARDEVRRAKERQESEVRLAQLELAHAEREEEAARKLWKRRAAAAAEVTRAAEEARAAREQLARARLPVEETRPDILQRALELAGREEALKRLELDLKRAARRSDLEAARVALSNLRLERQQAEIRAPIDGIVTRRDVEPGTVLEPGKPLMEIARQGGFRFEATVVSGDVGPLRPGMSARVELDAFDRQTYGTLDGTVSFISPDSDPATTDAPKGSTYTVKIAMNKDVVGRGPHRGQVKLGMAGQVAIVTERENLLVLLVKTIRRSVSLG